MPVDLKAIPLGVFLTREEAEQELQRAAASIRSTATGGPNLPPSVSERVRGHL
jgi:hypothetical protein